VFAAIASQGAGKYSSRTQRSQAQASDQWSFCQAKSIKHHLVETTLAQVKRGRDTDDPELIRTIKKLNDDLARYDKQKAEIKARAEALERARDGASTRSGRTGAAISYFTVAIATASICTGTKRKPL
jgi:hypothetical protein